VRNLLLALLAKAPAHGYELKVALEETFGNAWPPVNIGQIYTTLSRLERDGLVRSVLVAQEHRPDKKVYELTEEGLTEYRTWIATPIVGPRLRDDLFLKLILVQSPRFDEDNNPRVLIERQRRAILQSLRELNDLAARQNGAGNPGALLLIEGAILHLQADIQWLDLCESRLKPEN
jgi:DNA-binding PadR family transcriptional regulator